MNESTRWALRISAIAAATLALGTAPLAACAPSHATAPVTSCDAGVCDPVAIIANANIGAFTVGTKAIWFNDERSGRVYSMTRLGLDIQAVGDGAIHMTDIVETSSGVYWTAFGTIDIDHPSSVGTLSFLEPGQAPRVIASNLTQPSSLAALDGELYVSTEDGIFAMPIGGSALEPRWPDIVTHSLRAHDGYLYWYNRGKRDPAATLGPNDSTIQRWKPSDAAPTRLSPFVIPDEPSSNPYPIATPMVVDATGIYWSESGIQHLPLEGGTPETIASRQAPANALALSDNAIYWVEFNDPIFPKTSAIYSAPKSGAGAVSKLAEFEALADGLAWAEEGLFILARPTFEQLIDDLDHSLGVDGGATNVRRLAGPLLILPKDAL